MKSNRMRNIHSYVINNVPDQILLGKIPLSPDSPVVSDEALPTDALTSTIHKSRQNTAGKAAIQSRKNFS